MGTRTLLLRLTLVLSIALAASQTLPCDSSQESNPKTLDNTSKMAGNRERTFIMLKPDAVQRGLVGEIIKRFEQKGFKLVAMKMMHASVEHLEEHYADLKGKGFFPGLIKYMNSGPVVPMVWEGLNVVKTGRVMLGETNPAASAPGTIRGDFSIQVGRNMCHGSDAVDLQIKKLPFGSRMKNSSNGIPSPWDGCMKILNPLFKSWMKKRKIMNFKLFRVVFFLIYSKLLLLLVHLI